jgi:hypothetical protein
MVISTLASSQNLPDQADKNQLRHEGFIDEALVSRMLLAGTHQAQPAKQQTAALSSSEEDYAGWNLTDRQSAGWAA